MSAEEKQVYNELSKDNRIEYEQKRFEFDQKRLSNPDFDKPNVIETIQNRRASRQI